MAMGVTFVCANCKFAVEAWDDGNPYFLSYKGRPQFFYHPDGEGMLESYKIKYMCDALGAIVDQVHDEMFTEMLRHVIQRAGGHSGLDRDHLSWLKEDLSRLCDMVRSRLASVPALAGVTVPDYERLSERTGNMSDVLCLDCGRKFKRDLEKQKAVCPVRTCKSAKIVDVCDLNGKTCPKCKQGIFQEDPERRAMS